jgi:SAM-dependent methyltransferase
MSLVREARALVQSNGVSWTALFMLHRAAGALVRFADTRMQEREQRLKLPGMNSLSRNRDVWNTADWQQMGEQWSPSEAWKQALIDDVLLRYLPPHADTVIEIGPGGGRWSEELQTRTRQLVLVDISTTCLDLCRARFNSATNIRYELVERPTLRFMADSSVDFVWSFDVFVHIAPDDTLAYLQEFARVLRPGCLGVLHHPGQARTFGGYRSAVTSESFVDMLKVAGLTFVRQFDSWGKDGQYDVRMHRDVITVFSRGDASVAQVTR